MQLAHRRWERAHARAARRDTRGVTHARHVTFVDLVVRGDLPDRFVGVNMVVQHARDELGRIVRHGVPCGRGNPVAQPRGDLTAQRRACEDHAVCARRIPDGAMKKRSAAAQPQVWSVAQT